jgi:anti-sigma-K factor RskA
VNNCDQFRELMEAYALGALDPEDRAALEAHLATGCADCTRAVEEARWLVSQLAYTAPEAAPSDMLKGRLMQTVRAEARADVQAKPLVISTKPTIPFWLLAGVAALLIFSVYSAWNTRHLRDEIRQANERAELLRLESEKIDEQLAMAKREAMILMDPASVKIALARGNSEGPMLEAKWNSRLGVVVMGDKIPMPSAHHVLQLWFIPKDPKGKPMPSMMSWPDASGKLVMVISHPPDSMDNIKALAITEEPEGGSHWPTTTPRWVAGVS